MKFCGVAYARQTKTSKSEQNNYLQSLSLIITGASLFTADTHSDNTKNRQTPPCPRLEIFLTDSGLGTETLSNPSISLSCKVFC